MGTKVEVNRLKEYMEELFNDQHQIEINEQVENSVQSSVDKNFRKSNQYIHLEVMPPQKNV